MAVLYIAEFSDTYAQQGLGGSAAFQPAITTQTVVIGAGSLSSNAFNINTKVIRVHTDAICSILIGTAPTATAAKSRMAANATEYYAVPNTGTYKIAVITNV